MTAKDIILNADLANRHRRRHRLRVRVLPASAIRALSMEERMTVCNMSIEAGARAGLVAPDDTTYKYLERPARSLRRAPIGMPLSRAGSNCRPTKARPTTTASPSTPTRSSR